MSHRYVPGVKYIAGVTFQSEFGVHEAGSVVKQAMAFPNLEVLVDNRFLWPYAPDQGYEWLPPHLFNSVKTMDEVKAALEGDPHGTRSIPQFPDKDDPTKEGTKPAIVAQAEFEADQQPVIRQKMQATAQPGSDKDPGPSPEDVAAEAVGDKPAAKKTATPRSNNG